MKTMRRAVLASLVLLVGLGGGCGGGGGGGSDPDDPDEPSPRTELLVEEFLDTFDQDALASNADWGLGESGFLRSGPVTSRNAYAYAYPLTDDGVASGRGQYAELTAPLTGTDLATSPPYPPASQGRRVQLAFDDTVLGDAGSITAVAWGPVENRTVAATYPNVRLRLGFKAPGSASLGVSMAGNYASAPTVVYDGAYTVQAMADVGNTGGQPETAHVGGYAQGVGCNGAVGAPGGHNAGLFAYTGWYAWPALTTPFAWDPGDPLVDGDRTLIFDASVQAGDFTQRMRGWFASTFPCSGVLLAGWPETRVQSVYEGSNADPVDNFAAGILNPEPSTADMCFTLTSSVSVGQSLFFEGAFQGFTDYGVPELVPATQNGGAVVAVVFQGADAVEADRRTIDLAEPHTGWVSNIDACDGMRFIRFRITLTPDPVSLQPARVDRVTIPMTSLAP